MIKITTFFLAILLTTSIFSQDYKQLKEDREKFRLSEKEKFKSHDLISKYPITPNQQNIDITSYVLNLSIYPNNHMLEGSVVVSGKSLIDALDHVEIDLYEHMTVDSVLQNGNSISYNHSSGIINIPLSTSINRDELFTVEIFYFGNPANSPYGAFGWDKHGSPQVDIIWTLSEPFGAPSWWPCKVDPSDKADSVFLNITVPEQLVAASNGLLIDIENHGDGFETYSWKTLYPTSPYLISLAISNYEVLEYEYIGLDGVTTMPMTHYIYPELMANAEIDMPITTEMISVFARLFGEYPFINEKYGNALFPWGGGMEHQTLTSYGAGLVRGNNQYDWLNAHEVAHMWFGDNIALKTWAHVWLKEGLASYSEALWAESQGGTVAYNGYMDSQDDGAFQGSLFIADSTNADALFSNTVYDKASWVMHMLRGVLGDELFFESLKSYATDSRFYHKSSNTQDFQNVFESVTGQDLGWFIDEWVYRAGRPNYIFNWETTDVAPFITTLEIIQDNPEPYKMPIQIRLTNGTFDSTFTIWDSLSVQEFSFETGFTPNIVEIDPENWILKNLTEGELHTMGGFVIDAETSQPISNALVTWEGPMDEFSGFALNADTTSTSENGFFQFYRPNGIFQLTASKEGYLFSPYLLYNHSEENTTLELKISQPEISVNLDSLLLTIEGGEIIDTTILISNVGSGEMFAQIIEGNHTSLSKVMPFSSPVIPKSLSKNLVSGNIYKSSSPKEITDEDWKLLYIDEEENPNNIFDLENIYYKKDRRNNVIKITTHQNPTAFELLRVNVFLETDSDPTNGFPGRDFNADYLVAVGNFGQGYMAVLLLWNPSISDFDFIAMSEIFEANVLERSLTFSFSQTLIGNPSVLKMKVQSFEVNNLHATQDFAPANNLGFLSTETLDIQWINADPNFVLTDGGGEMAVNLNITTDGISSGMHETALMIYSTSVDGMAPYYLPIKLDYLTDIDKVDSQIPKEYSLHQNYPNPFNPSTTIKFGLPEASQVKLTIYNLLGQVVAVPINKEMISGYHQVNFDASSLSSGIYLYKINTENYNNTKKMILLR